MHTDVIAPWPGWSLSNGRCHERGFTDWKVQPVCDPARPVESLSANELRANKVILVGRTSVVGCASVVQLGDGLYDVCIYDDTPVAVVAHQAETGNFPEGLYCQIPADPTWFAQVLMRISMVCGFSLPAGSLFLMEGDARIRATM